MKQNLTESQYIQIAREQFGRMIEDIPFVSDVEIFAADSSCEYGNLHAIVHYKDNETPLHFWLEVKSRGERRFVNEYMIKRSQQSDENCYVFVAPYFSEESAEIMKKRLCSYMDLSGNCFILTKRIILSVSGRENKYLEKREKKNYLAKASGAASTIMRTMLANVDEEWQVITLADKSGKAIGTVSNVKSFLKDNAWIQESQNGFGIYNIREMLFAWAKDYHKKDDRTYELYSLDGIAEIEKQIGIWSEKHDNRALLTGFSAAARYAPTVRYQKVEVYVEQQYFDEFLKDLDLQTVSSGGNVFVTIPHDETPCLYSRTIDGYHVASPVQTVIDLLKSAGRGEEAAEAIIAKEYKGR